MAKQRMPTLLLRVFVFLIVPLLLVHLFVFQSYDPASYYYKLTSSEEHALLEQQKATLVVVSNDTTTSTNIKGNTRSINTKTMALSRSKRNPIFYNLYLPQQLPEKARIFGDDWSRWDTATRQQHFTKHLKRILHEQIQEWQQTAPNHTLLYVQMGADDTKTTTITNALTQCSRSRDGTTTSFNNCHRLEYLPIGNEVNTLQHLYEYCQDHPDEVVAYIHNKGSFHASYNNEKQRRVGTKAALECLSAMTAETLQQPEDHQLPPPSSSSPPTQCNVCTGHFQVVPQFLALSNMWSAHCEYVTHLIPPKLFEATLAPLYDTILSPPNNYNHSQTLYPCLAPQSTAANHLGRGRYAMERWIWTHPNLQPCDILPRPLPQLSGEFPQNPHVWTAKVHRAPSKNVGFYLKHEKNNFARLEGRLLEYQYLYGQLPSEEDSWIWSYYIPKFRQGPPSFLNTCLAQKGACTMLPVNGSHPLCNITKGKWVY